MDIRKRANEIAHATDNLWFPRWVQNSFDNYDLICTHMEGNWHRNDFPVLERIAGKHKGQPAVVLGSGPSLDKNIEALKDWEGVIFCGPAQIQALKRLGIEADYLTPVDSNPIIMRLTQIGDLEYKKTTLLATPLMHPAFLKAWFGKRLYYLPEVATTKAQDDDELLSLKDLFDKYPPAPDFTESAGLWFHNRMNVFIKKVLHEAYLNNPRIWPGLRPSIKNAGNTSCQGITIANYLGCEPIFLMGCDLCFDGEKTRAATWQYDRTMNEYYRWFRNDIYEQRSGVEFNGKQTTEGMVIDIYDYVLTSIYENMQIIEVGDGALNYFPKITVEEFQEGKDFKHLYRHKDERLKLASEWIEKNTGQKLLFVGG